MRHLKEQVQIAGKIVTKEKAVKDDGRYIIFYGFESRPASGKPTGSNE